MGVTLSILSVHMLNQKHYPLVIELCQNSLLPPQCELFLGQFLTLLLPSIKSFFLTSVLTDQHLECLNHHIPYWHVGYYMPFTRNGTYTNYHKSVNSCKFH
ncbi:hypothetical protein Ancab_027821 [Ancistrocladus abbreviatus]